MSDEEIVVNSMEGKYEVYQTEEKEIDVDINIRQENQSDLNCVLYIEPRNSMWGMVDLYAAPRYTKKFEPSDEVYIREDVPTFGYYGVKTLYLGTDDQQRYRAFIKFSDVLEELPDDKYITEAKLKLNFANYDEFLGFELSDVVEDWVDSNVTWQSQPNRLDILEIKDLEDGQSEVTFDVTELVDKWYKGEKDNYGFLLKAHEDYRYNEQLKGIRSSLTTSPPLLEVEYLDPDITYFGSKTIDSELVVRQEDHSEINASLEVPEYKGASEISSSIWVHNHRELVSSVLVNQRDLDSWLVIPKALDANLTVVVTSGHRTIQELNCNMLVNKKILYSDINIFQKNDLDSEIVVRQEDKNDLDASIEINKSFLPATIKIPSTNRMKGKVKIIDGGVHLDSSLEIHRSYLDSEIDIRKHSSIMSYMQVRQENENDLNCSIEINRPFLNSEINVRSTNDLDSKIEIRKSDDLDSKIIIRQEDEENLSANIDIRKHSSLDSNIEVNVPYLSASLFVRGENDLDSEITIFANNDLDSTLDITHAVHLTSKLTVRQIWFNDLNSSLIIDREVTKRRGYAFII